MKTTEQKTLFNNTQIEAITENNSTLNSISDLGNEGRIASNVNQLCTLWQWSKVRFDFTKFLDVVYKYRVNKGAARSRESGFFLQSYRKIMKEHGKIKSSRKVWSGSRFVMFKNL